ncbi:hypothetical protein [Enterococcus sp.]|uniref:hypothetical protein n=1 Tax=Enterococcus sp. TaxID=35783 RepID=UPI0029100C5D|nr:hypothetical protein [Enterococcus sp.]MDU5336588.1 hypothetical protein [Enterococcus sp.]
MKDKNEIKLLYIDDQVEDALSEYLENLEYRIPNLKTQDREFESKTNYLDLLGCSDLTESNILLIDSRLFEESDLDLQERFTGEEFKLIIKKEYPFIEVLIISQNPDCLNLGFIPKFNSRLQRHSEINAEKHYDKVLLTEIKKAMLKVKQNQKILDKLKNNETLDENVRDMIDNSVHGIDEYKTMNSEDIDKLVAGFKKIEELLEE